MRVDSYWQVANSHYGPASKAVTDCWVALSARLNDICSFELEQIKQNRKREKDSSRN